ncbi:50S ribosomal protein L25 [Candidatus Woesebacteria bacterium]|nr:MAG: 50S ribosomal protein L25 [Candidatus Woesebacteria bacterium]
MDKHTLKAEKRKILGQKVKTLRKEGVLPANIYGKKVKSLAIQIPMNDFQKVYKEAGETGIVEIAVDSSKKPVLINNVQVHPVTDIPIHVDFLQIDLKEKVTADVPVDLIGESPAEKSGLGTVVQQINEIEVEALPTDLPEKFEVDLSKLTKVDMAVLVKELDVDKKKVEIKSDAEQILVKVEPPRKEEEVIVPVETEDEEGEVEEGEEPSEEGKAPEGEEEEKKEEKTEDKPEKKEK